METYIATFHTHLSALRSCGALKKAGCGGARLAPVPRALSSSCGTCVLYQGKDPLLPCMDADMEAVYRLIGKGYEEVYRSEE